MFAALIPYLAEGIRTFSGVTSLPLETPGTRAVQNLPKSGVR